ncbi:MAG: TraB/GumN family protein [Bacteroidota bacterium]
MKKCTTLLLLLFLLLSSIQAQVAEQQPQAAADNPNNSLLWEIRGDSLEQPSYLYGTIHMIGKDDYFLTDSTKAAFDRAERVTFEINMEDMTDFSVIFSLMTKVMMNDGVTLPDLLSKEDYAFVEKKFKEMGLPMMMLNRLKPMFLSVFASGDMEPGGLSNGSLVSYEVEFMEMAQQDKKEMAGLETVEYQMSMFDSIPYKAQADMLVESLKAGNDGSDEFAEMVKMYKTQDISAMQKMFDDGGGGVGEYEDLLLGNRNRNWIPIMAKMMKEKPTFFAVGAGHLGGKQGVIQLLRDAGYTLSPKK